MKKTMLTVRTLSRFEAEYKTAHYTAEQIETIEHAAYVANMNQCNNPEWTEADIFADFLRVLSIHHIETEPAEADETETVPETAEQATPDGIAYEIRENSEYNSREVYFSGKPAAETREALKALKMRWHSVKKCWYGYAAEHEIISAIQGAELAANPDTGAVVVTDGYMGGGAIYGAKSGTNLFGAELAKVFRQEIKKAGIKGVTIATRAGMTDHYSITVTIEREDVTEAPTADPTNHYTCEMLRDFARYAWITIGGESYHRDRVEMMTAEEQTALALQYHREERERYAHNVSLNSYHMSGKDHPELKPAFIAKLAKIKNILDAYRYDESNSMVDYFNTNFYYDFYTKPGKSWAA